MKENFSNKFLEEGTVQIVGIYSYSKDGKNGSSLSYLQSFENWQAERAVRIDGVRAETEFSRMDCSQLNVGDIVRLIYKKGFRDRAELVGYSIVEPANN